MFQIIFAEHENIFWRMYRQSFPCYFNGRGLEVWSFKKNTKHQKLIKMIYITHVLLLYIFYVFWIHTIALDKKPKLLFTENIHTPFCELLTQELQSLELNLRTKSVRSVKESLKLVLWTRPLSTDYQQIHRKIWFCSWIGHIFLIDSESCIDAIKSPLIFWPVPKDCE